MPPKKARFGNRCNGGGKSGKGRCRYMEVAATAGARINITTTEASGHIGEMTMIITPAGEIEVDDTLWDRGRRDSWGYGPSTSHPCAHARDRFITQMMENEHYQYHKQNDHDPDFIGSGASDCTRPLLR